MSNWTLRSHLYTALRTSRRQPRRGTSVVEVLVAMLVLATAVTGIGQFASATRQGLRDRELSSRIHWELANAREQIGTWHPAQITQEQIESFPISPALARQLNAAQWKAQVVRVSDPAAAWQITLTLHGSLHGQAVQPASLVFWVEQEVASESSPVLSPPAKAAP